MRARWVASGLRARLTLSLGVILSFALSVAFLGVFRVAGTEVRAQADQDLRHDLPVLAREVAPAGQLKQQAFAKAVRGYVKGQRSFGSAARLYVVRIADGQTVTNEPELLGFARDASTEHETVGQQQGEQTQRRAVLTASPGLHTFSLIDSGPVRVLVSPLLARGREIAILEVGEPLAAVDRAQEGVRHAFLLVGLLALAGATLVGFPVIGRMLRPLRQIADTARRIDAGELDHRNHTHGASEEVQTLADALDHMLDRLQHAFERQRAFVGDASHELRTPLTIVAGQIEVLASQADPKREDVARVAQIVDVEIARMKRLTDELLLLASADEGRLSHRHRFDLAPFLSVLIAGLHQLGDRRYECSAIPAGTLDADPDRLAQVLRNLARNAVEHTQPGGLVRVTATAHGDRLTLGVEDDGVGVPPAERERVFERFHRTDMSRARAHGGSGLGLAIAQAVIAEHGGRIWAEQAPAGGARIAFELPGFQAPASRPAPQPWSGARAR